MIVKVPGLNNLGKNNGCRNAGSAIIKMLDEIHSNESGKIIDTKLLDIKEIQVDNQNLEEQGDLIFNNAKKILQGERAIFLGGDHSISYSIGRSFLEACKDNRACLIVFDAHADCMQRIKEPTHEEWLRALIEQGFPKENILLVGIRNIEKQEIEFLSKNKIVQISMSDLNKNIEEITDIIMEFSKGRPLYVSFDIDVIDPAFAGSTGYREVGGLTSRQALYILSRINKMKNLKCFDIVEVDSENDRTGMTTKLAAKLVAELL